MFHSSWPVPRRADSSNRAIPHYRERLCSHDVSPDSPGVQPPSPPSPLPLLPPPPYAASNVFPSSLLLVFIFRYTARPTSLRILWYTRTTGGTSRTANSSQLSPFHRPAGGRTSPSLSPAANRPRQSDRVVAGLFDSVVSTTTIYYCQDHWQLFAVSCFA